MPARNEIQEEIYKAKATAQDQIRRKYIKILSDYTHRDVVVYITAYTTIKMMNVPPNLVAIQDNDIHGFMSALHGLKSDNLDLVIHSPGGSAETTIQIVNYLRKKYKHIRVIIPQSGMSAATMLACASNEIIMSKHSAIGPIDPQITFPTPSGLFTAPAHSLIKEFEKAKEEILKNRDIAPLWIKKFENLPHGILDICKNSIELSKETVIQWLTSFMFENEVDAQEKANTIGEWLGNPDNHKSHGKPIPYDDPDLKFLKIKLLEDDQELQEHVLSVFHSSILTIEVTNCIKIIENQNGKGLYINFEKK